MLLDLIIELLHVLLFVVAVLGVFFFGLPKLPGFVLAGLFLLLYSMFSHAPVIVYLILWILFTAIAVLSFKPPIRREFVSSRLKTMIKKRIPQISNTEQEALEAGTTGWDTELFSGNPDWEKWLQGVSVKGELNDKERAFLDEQVETLCNMLDDWHITAENHALPEPVWQFIRTNGFFGLIIPEAYGGLAFSAHAHAQVIERIASRSVTAGVTVMVPNSLGPGALLLEYGTEEQKSYYLPKLASGDEVPCFALTGVQSGSDAASMSDTGIICRQMFEGKEVIGIKLNWSKRYITLAPVATLLGLAFHLYDPDKILGEEQDIGITLALIPINTSGIEVGERHMPLNTPFMNGPVYGKDVFIPMDWIIGGPAYAGKGWRMLMECLADGRGIALPALATAAAKFACLDTGAYARVREQFHLPISRFDGIAAPLARIAGNTYLMSAAAATIAAAINSGEKPAVLSAIVKYHLTERMRDVINDAMDIRGGSGICIGPRNHIARIYQAAPIAITVEGANILTRSMIIFGQGSMRCHPWLYREMQAALAGDSEYDLEEFDDLICQHLTALCSNIARSLFLGLAGEWLMFKRAGIKPYVRRLSRLSAAFAVVSDYALLRLGGTLKRKEYVSALLGDMLSTLYLASATLKYYHDQDYPNSETVLVKWALDECERCFHTAMLDLLDNLPGLPMRLLLRGVIYPYGKPCLSENSRLIREVADTICTRSEARSRLTENVFIAADKSDPLVKLLSAMEKVIAAETSELKLRHAVREGLITVDDRQQQIQEACEKRILTAEEADLINQAYAARLEAIQVDQFRSDYWSRS